MLICQKYDFKYLFYSTTTTTTTTVRVKLFSRKKQQTKMLNVTCYLNICKAFLWNNWEKFSQIKNSQMVHWRSYKFSNRTLMNLYILKWYIEEVINSKIVHWWSCTMYIFKWYIEKVVHSQMVHWKSCTFSNGTLKKLNFLKWFIDKVVHSQLKKL